MLSIVDSSYHILKDVKNQSTLQYEEPKKQEQKEEKLVNYRERFSLEIPYVGVSLVNSYPQVQMIVILISSPFLLGKSFFFKS